MSMHNRVLYGTGYITNIMRHYDDNDRDKAQRERFRNALEFPAPDYPTDRKPGKITVELNGMTLVVDLIPDGNCTQWRVLFGGVLWVRNGSVVVAGMKQIHAEIRRRMPPARSCRS